jgi:hypothetical protein
MARILTHRDRAPLESALDWHVRHHWPPQEDRFDPRPPKKGDPTAEAVVNHGRWIVRCPFCTGAQLADPDERVFFCIDCLNHKVQGRIVRVKWPSPALRGPIEQALTDRPVTTNRNWESREELSYLLAENVMNGVGTVYSRKGGSQLDETGSLPLPTGQVGDPG